MVDVMPLLPDLSPVRGKAVVASFDGGRLSSEGGLLALREIERRLGMADRLAACLNDPRGACRKLWRRPHDGLYRPQFQGACRNFWR